MENISISHELRVLTNLIRQKTFSHETLNEVGPILGSQGYIIKFLSDNQGKDVFQKDIEKTFKIRRSTVTDAINRMEKGGLIKRESVNFDSRLKKISLTEKGIAVHNIIDKSFKNTENELKSALTKQELELFFSLIKKLQTVVEKV